MGTLGSSMKKGVVAGAAAAAMLAGSTSPASAAGTGVTTGGSSTISGTGSGLPTCLKTNNTPTIQLLNAGDVQVGTGVYAGTFTANFSLAGPFYFNPAATYGADSTCTVPGPTPVTTWNLSGTSPTGSVSCGSPSTAPASLGYARVGDVYTITVTGSCTVNGVSAGSGPVTFEFTGNQNPCLPLVNNCEGTLNNTEFGPGTYAQA